MGWEKVEGAERVERESGERERDGEEAGDPLA